MSNRISAVLIDDESKLIDVLRLKLEAHCPEIEVIGTAQSAAAGYQIINELNPKLVFLDIGLPDETGFDLLKRFNEINFETIFVTGYDHYTLEAIEFCAIGYVLKPVSNDDLIAAVDRARERLNRIKFSEERYTQFLAQITQPSEHSKKIGIPTQEGLEFVKLNEIVRCEANLRFTQVALTDGSKIDSSYNLGSFHKLLANYGFFLCHKSHLINLQEVLKYDKDGVLIMTDGNMVPLSRRKKAEFLSLIEKII